MQKRFLLGSVLFSVSTWTSLGLADHAQHQHQHQHQHQQSRWTLDDLKQKCREAEGNEQILPFDSQFHCSDSRTFWALKGYKRFALDNEANVRFKALIKDGAHDTDWYDLPGRADGQFGTCPIEEQWKASLSYAVTIHSCADLEKIDTEHSYCAAVLAEGWEECNHEQADATARGPFEIPAAARCQYVRTGDVRSCEGESHTPCQQRQQQCQQQQGQKPCQQQQGQQQQGQQQQGQTQVDEASCVEDEQLVDEFQLGAEVKLYKVENLPGHPPVPGKHRVVKIASEPLPGGMLAALGLHKDDIVSHVGLVDKKRPSRTRSVEAFMQHLTRAKAAGGAKVEYRNSNGDWVTVEEKL